VKSFVTNLHNLLHTSLTGYK